MRSTQMRAASWLLLGYGIVYGIKRATANEYGVSYLTITIDGERAHE